MRLRRAAQLLATGALASGLNGCAHPAADLTPPPPNPFGYYKPAATCVVPTVAIPATGRTTTTMTLSGDGGYCGLHLVRASGGPFAAGLVTRVPAHGQPFIYNYNNATVVTYTATAGFLGSDTMTIELIPGANQPRVQLDVAITVANSAPRS